MTDRFSPITLQELHDLKVPALEWAVDGLLPLGSATLLFAREKAGKGLLSLDCLASIAADETFLDRAVKTGPVIYAAAEDSDRLVRHRILHRVGDRLDLQFYVLRLNGSTPDRLDLEVGESMAKLDQMIEDIKPVAVVIDTLREIHRGREDTSDDMAPLLRATRQLAHKHNTALLMNHHGSKAGGFRGSTAIAAAFDQVIEFVRDDSADDSITGLLRVEGRDVARTFIRIKYGAADGRWAVTGDAVPEIVGDTRQRILSALRSPEGHTSEELAAQLNIAHRTVQNVITAMRKEPLRPFVILAAGKKGAPARYAPLQPEMIRPESLSHRGRDERTNREMHPDSSGTHGTNAGTNAGAPLGSPGTTGTSATRDGARAAYDLPPGHVLLSPEDPLGNVNGTVANLSKMTPEGRAAYRAEVEALTGDDPDTLHDQEALARFDRMTREIESMRQVGEQMNQVGRMNGEAPAPPSIHTSIKRLRADQSEDFVA